MGRQPEDSSEEGGRHQPVAARPPSPVRAQYDALKQAHPGAVLLFQLGDFYECFEGDARLVARVCGITLTTREFARGDRVPLAGFPVARAERHIGRLVGAGHHVAICDQVSEPGRGLVERQVTRVITAGTVAEPGLVSPTENNLLAAVRRGRRGIGLAHVDVTTGELLATVLDGPNVEVTLEAELQRLQPAECLIGVDEGPLPDAAGHLTPLDRGRFGEAAADDALRRLFGVGALDAYGVTAESPALGPLGALVGYVEEKNRPLLASLREPRSYNVGAHMVLDPSTRRNLELTRTSWGGRARGSLLDAVDRTRTPMGARRLRRALGQPLLDRAALEGRLDQVDALVHRPDLRARLRLCLARLGDMERLVGRVRQGSATPREALALARSLRVVPELHGPAEDPDLGPDRELGTGLAPRGAAPDSAPLPEAGLAACAAAADLIESALVEHPTTRVIKPGYSDELDDLLDGIVVSRRWIADLERRERERSGIRSLKVGYNKVFGYYIGIEELERELLQALLRRVGELGPDLVETIVAVAELGLPPVARRAGGRARLDEADLRR